MKKFTSKFIMFVLVALLALTAVGCGGKTKIPTEELDALKAELEQLKSDKAALESAALNVYINTKSMKDRELAESMNAEVQEMMDKYCRMASEVYASVAGRLH